MSKNSDKRKFFGCLFWLAALIGFNIVSNLYQNTSLPSIERTDYYSVSEDSLEIKRCWKEYYGKWYCLSYVTDTNRIYASEYFRENDVKPSWSPQSEDYWSSIYSQIYVHERVELDFIMDSLRQMKLDHNLTYYQFLNSIITLVQDIPYCWVLRDRKCKEVAVNGRECIEGVEFGLFSPVEFLTQLHGDCDTRTLTLYTLLKNFGFDVVIFNSDQYLHSMLGINTMATGDYKKIGTKKYYFVETTGIGWEPGVLPSEMSNKNNWYLAQK